MRRGGGSAARAAERDPRYPLGVVLVLLGGTCLSLSGIILRHIETADGWQILFYRSVAFLATVLTFLAVRYRGRLVAPFRAVGLRGAAVALCLGLGAVCYVFSILLTTVADAVFIISSAPFFTAVLGWLVLSERVRRSTWAAMGAALVGIALMFADGITGGRLLGNVIAFGVVVTFAVMLVVLRASRAIDMLPATCLAGLVSGGIGMLMAGDLAIPLHDLLLALLLGSVQFAGGFILITLGSRHVPAAEIALLSLTETILAPVWVWIGVDEVPTLLSLGGGAIVLGAVAVQAVAGMRAERHGGRSGAGRDRGR